MRDASGWALPVSAILAGLFILGVLYSIARRAPVSLQSHSASVEVLCPHCRKPVHVDATLTVSPPLQAEDVRPPRPRVVYEGGR